MFYTLLIASIFSAHPIRADEMRQELYALCDKMAETREMNVNECVRRQSTAFIKVQGYLNDIEVYSGNMIEGDGYSFDGLAYFACLDESTDVDGYINYVDFQRCLEP